MAEYIDIAGNECEVKTEKHLGRGFDLNVRVELNVEIAEEGLQDFAEAMTLIIEDYRI